MLFLAAISCADVVSDKSALCLRVTSLGEIAYVRCTRTGETSVMEKALKHH